MMQLWRKAKPSQRFASLMMLLTSALYVYLFAVTLDEGQVRSIFWLAASFLFIGFAFVQLAPGTTPRERLAAVPLVAHYSIGAFFGGSIICCALAFMQSLGA